MAECCCPWNGSYCAMDGRQRWRAVRGDVPYHRVYDRVGGAAAPEETVTGMGSPVSADSFSELVPSTTVPSTGTQSPGSTTIMSPGCNVSAGTCAQPCLFCTASLTCAGSKPCAQTLVCCYCVCVIVHSSMHWLDDQADYENSHG